MEAHIEPLNPNGEPVSVVHFSAHGIYGEPFIGVLTLLHLSPFEVQVNAAMPAPDAKMIRALARALNKLGVTTAQFVRMLEQADGSFKADPHTMTVRTEDHHDDDR